MIWGWWAVMAVTGLIMGGIAAWTTGAYRVFMRTLAIPLALTLSRLVFPLKASPFYVGYLLIDLFVISVGAFFGDYLIGLRMGRSDKGGYRDEEVGH